MGTGAGITFLLKDGKEHYTFTHYDGYYRECGKKLWYFLRGLKAGQWTALEQKLQNHVKWVGEHDSAKGDDQKLYGSKYRWLEDIGRRDSCMMKEMFGKLNSSPAHTLHEVLHGRLQHMICYSPSYLSDHAQFEYRVDFISQSLSVLQEDTWIKVPLISNQEVDLLFRFEVGMEPLPDFPYDTSDQTCQQTGA